jgi:hypothetical protein
MRAWAVMGSVIAVVGCGDDPAPDPNDCPTEGGASCFQLPTEPMAIRYPFVAPDLDCGEMVPVAARMPFTLVGRVYDFQSGEYYTVPAANVELFVDASFSTPIATFVTDAMGNYSIAMPAGTPDILYAHVTSALTAEEYLHAIRSSHTLSPDIESMNIAAARSAFIDDVAELVRVPRTPDTAFAFVRVWDCDGMPIEHTEVMLSTKRGAREFVRGVTIVYGAPGDPPVPVLVTARSDTANNGASGIFNIPPADVYYLQAWGFHTDDDLLRGEDGLSLVLEYPVRIEASLAYGITYRANVIDTN